MEKPDSLFPKVQTHINTRNINVNIITIVKKATFCVEKAFTKNAQQNKIIRQEQGNRNFTETVQEI
jgi:hypothetical protein